MGYDLNKFVDIQELPNHLRCLICNLVLEPLDALQAPTCEHNYCNQCITIHLQSTNHCPHYEEDSLSVKSDKKKSPLRKMSFRKIIGKSPKDKLPSLKLSDLKSLPDTLVHELNALKVFCDFSSNGCDEKLKLSDLNEHVKNCKFIDSKSDQQLSVKTNETADGQNENRIQSSEQINNSKDKKEGQQIDEQTRVEIVGEQSNSEIIEQSLEMSASNQSENELKRKNSEVKSVNGEPGKLVSEEEIGSDDFVVIPKTIKASSSSTKSTESVQTNNSTNNSEPTLISSKENVNKEDDDMTVTNVEKKKKKKKKKKTVNKADGETVSLKEADSGSHSGLSVGSKTQSKESLIESEEVKRALKDAETKSENLRLINSQLLGQIKKLKEEREEITNKLQTQLSNDDTENLKDKIRQLENENKEQAIRIIELLDNNEHLNRFILTLRDEQTQLKEKFSATLNDVQQTLKYVKTCKQI